LSPAETVRARAGLLAFVGLLYASACGGPYGMENYVAQIGPGLFILMLFVTPWLWGVPMAFASAELSSRRPVVGGYYRWVHAYLGEFPGYLAGIWSLFSSLLDNALYPVLFARGIAHFVPSLTRFEQWLLAVALIFVLTFLNYRGIEIAGRAAVMLNAFLLAPLLWLMGAALLNWRGNPFVPFAAPGTAPEDLIGTGLALSMWLYSGYYEVSTAALEVENPRRAVPLAIAVVTPLVVLSYALPTVALLATSTDWATWTSGQFATGGDALGGRILGDWLFLGSVASYSVIFLAYVVWWSRLAWALADDGYLPGALRRLHPRFGTPHRVLLAYGVLYAVMAWLPFQDLLVADSWLAGAYTMLIHFAVLRARRTEPEGGDGFRIPGGAVGLWLNVLVPLATWTALLVFTQRHEAWLGLGFLVAGPVLYAATRLVRWFLRPRPPMR
jgi:amino acid transporter